MTVKEKKKNRIFLWLSAGVLLITAVCVCLTSCRFIDDAKDEGENKSPSAQMDAYDAKIVYYEAQLQSLSAQLGSMEQQFFMMKEEYLNQLQALEQKLSESQKPEPDPEDSPTQKEDEGGKEPSQDTDSSGEDVILCDYTYRLESGYAILTSYRGSEKDVVIPAAVDGYLVIGLGDRMFADCDVRSVTLPQTVERLGWFTFYGCKNLEKVVLPSGIKNIGYASFDGCAANLCLHVVSGSFAEQFAVSFGLNY